MMQMIDIACNRGEREEREADVVIFSDILPLSHLGKLLSKFIQFLLERSSLLLGVR